MRRFWIGIGCAAAVAFIGGVVWQCNQVLQADGMRLLHMEVYQKDQLVLRTFFSVRFRASPADIWQRAGAEPFESEAQVARVKADEDNPLRATLTGPVRINITHREQLVTSTSLTNLVLLRSGPESLKWYLAPKEVERTTRAAGL